MTLVVVASTVVIVASALLLAWSFVAPQLSDAQLAELRCRLRRRHVWVLVVDPTARRTYLECPACHATTRGVFS